MPSSSVAQLNEPLQEWINAHNPADNRLWKGGFWHQVIFVRDQLHGLFVPNWEQRDAQPVRVVGTHTSKSVLLPVYRISVRWLDVQLRHNFYNWMVSVSSDRPIPDVFYGLFKPDTRINAVYCEGFTPDWVFGPYADDHQRFTIQLGDEYDVHTFCYILTSVLGVRGVQLPYEM